MRTKKYLKNKSKTYKKELFQKFLLLGEGHPGSIFSMMDIVVSLYHNGHLRFDKKKEFLKINC